MENAITLNQTPMTYPMQIVQPVTSYIINITPELAAYWMTFNIGNNRAISQNGVALYANDMTRGNFTLNPDAITFNKNGELTNGQHRLNAVIKSGQPINALVVFDFPVTQQDFMNFDTGRKRGSRDGLIVAGYKKDDLVLRAADIASAYIRIKYNSGKGGLVSNSDRVGFIEANADMMEWACDIGRHRYGGGGGGRAASRIPSVIVVAMIDAKQCGENEDALRKYANVYCDNNFDDTESYSQQYAIEARTDKSITKVQNLVSLREAKAYINAFARGLSKRYVRDNLYNAERLRK